MRYISKTIATLILAWVGSAGATSAESSANQVVSSDIGRFWNMYDRITMESDPVRQHAQLQRLFVHPGTDGLKAFMQVKGYDANCYLDTIRRYPKFWTSVRKSTIALQQRKNEFEPAIAKLRALYPELRPATIYLAIGCLRSAGTISDNKVLIGAELAAGDDTVDLSELPERLRKSLSVYFHSRPAEQLILLNIHELVHTQQRGPGQTLLAQAMYEGAADFVTELVMSRVPALPYMAYGREHEANLKRDFQAEMHGPSWDGWLYNGPGNRYGVGDLGYYIGYAIMRDYYRLSADKKKALREIIELDYRDQKAVNKFVATSRFF